MSNLDYLINERLEQLEAQVDKIIKLHKDIFHDLNLLNINYIALENRVKDHFTQDLKMHGFELLDLEPPKDI